MHGQRNIKKRLFLVYFFNLYMFRAYLGPSSGGITVCIQQLVLIILFRWLSVVLVGMEQPNQDNRHVLLLHIKYPLFLPGFNQTSIFWTDFREKVKNRISWKPPPQGTELFHADVQTWQSWESLFAILRKATKKKCSKVRRVTSSFDTGRESWILKQNSRQIDVTLILSPRMWAETEWPIRLS